MRFEAIEIEGHCYVLDNVRNGAAPFGTMLSAEQTVDHLESLGERADKLFNSFSGIRPFTREIKPTEL